MTMLNSESWKYEGKLRVESVVTQINLYASTHTMKWNGEVEPRTTGVAIEMAESLSTVRVLFRGPDALACAHELTAFLLRYLSAHGDDDRSPFGGYGTPELLDCSRWPGGHAEVRASHLIDVERATEVLGGFFGESLIGALGPSNK